VPAALSADTLPNLAAWMRSSIAPEEAAAMAC
jgi:hypothetical protein